MIMYKAENIEDNIYRNAPKEKNLKNFKKVIDKWQ